MVNGISLNKFEYTNPYGAALNNNNDANNVNKNSPIKSENSEGLNGEPYCKSCSERKYKDESGDSGVSFQTPQNISPGRSATAVYSHEREHYSRDKAKAERENKEVLSSSIQVFYSSCPECGRRYASGGVTRTLTKGESDQNKNSQNKIGNETRVDMKI